MRKATVRLGIYLAVILAAKFSVALSAQVDVSIRGMVDSVEKRGNSIFLKVTIVPSASDSSPGVVKPEQDPSVTTDLSKERPARVTAGMPVKLDVQSAGGYFSPSIGTVESVTDASHCVVKVDPAAMDQGWQDPSDNSNHKVKEYLKPGARVTINAPLSGGRRPIRR